MRVLITKEERNVLIECGLYDENIFKVNEDDNDKIFELSKLEFDLFKKVIKGGMNGT